MGLQDIGADEVPDPGRTLRCALLGQRPFAGRHDFRICPLPRGLNHRRLGHRPTGLHIDRDIPPDRLCPIPELRRIDGETFADLTGAKPDLNADADHGDCVQMLLVLYRPDGLTPETLRRPVATRPGLLRI